MLEILKERVNADAALVRRGRWVSLSFLLGIGNEDYIVTIDEGRISGIALRNLATISGVFSIRAASTTWEEHWRPIPKRDYHDIWSMLPKGLAKIDGDLLPLMQNLQYFKDVIASPRDREV
jgi:hypothetical protein